MRSRQRTPKGSSAKWDEGTVKAASSSPAKNQFKHKDVPGRSLNGFFSMFKLNRNFNILENIFQGQATLAITKFFSEIQVYVLWCNFNPLHPQGPLDQFIPVYEVPSYLKSSSRHETKTNKNNKEVSQMDFSFKLQIGFFLFCLPVLDTWMLLTTYTAVWSWSIHFLKGTKSKHYLAEPLHVQNIIGVLFSLYCHI